MHDIKAIHKKSFSLTGPMYGLRRVEIGRDLGEQDTNQRKTGKFYRLTLLFSEITDGIERDKRADADKQLEMIRQLGNYIAT